MQWPVIAGTPRTSFIRRGPNTYSLQHRRHWVPVASSPCLVAEGDKFILFEPTAVADDPRHSRLAPGKSYRAPDPWPSRLSAVIRPRLARCDCPPVDERLGSLSLSLNHSHPGDPYQGHLYACYSVDSCIAVTLELLATDNLGISRTPLYHGTSSVKAEGREGVHNIYKLDSK